MEITYLTHPNQFTKLVCAHCGKEFYRTNAQVNQRRKANPDSKFFCSRECCSAFIKGDPNWSSLISDRKKLAMKDPTKKKEFVDKMHKLRKDWWLRIGEVGQEEFKRKVSKSCKTRWESRSSKEKESIIQTLTAARDIRSTNGVGAWESEVKEFLESLGVDVSFHKRIYGNNQNCDLVVESRKIGIELNGAYWHSDKYTPNDYHFKKTNCAERNGYRLIHLWDFEWNNEQENIKKYLMAQLGIYDKKVHAKSHNFSIGESREDALKLLDYHQQGKLNASHYLVGYWKGEPVITMLIVPSRYERDVEFEIAREVCKAGWSIIEGKSALFNYFKGMYKPKSVCSFVDRAKFSGKSYLNMGFKLRRINAPRYDWVICRGSNRTEFVRRSPRVYSKMKKLYNEGLALKIFGAGRYLFVYESEGGANGD